MTAIEEKALNEIKRLVHQADHQKKEPMSTEERIIEEAKEYALRNTPSIVETYSVNSYIAGALSERNKTIKQMEIILTRILSTSYHLPEVLKNLESLKV